MYMLVQLIFLRRHEISGNSDVACFGLYYTKYIALKAPFVNLILGFPKLLNLRSKAKFRIRMCVVDDGFRESFDLSHYLSGWECVRDFLSSADASKRLHQNY